MIHQEKRKNSIFLPIRRDGDRLLVYLQKRLPTAKKLPNYFGFWGGGAEDSESPEEALVREVREELGFELDLSKVSHFNHYEFLGSEQDVFLFESSEDWEKNIVIGEGEYGAWFSTEEALAKTDFIFENKVVVNDLERRLLNKPIA